MLCARDVAMLSVARLPVGYDVTSMRAGSGASRWVGSYRSRSAPYPLSGRPPVSGGSGSVHSPPSVRSSVTATSSQRVGGRTSTSSMMFYPADAARCSYTSLHPATAAAAADFTVKVLDADKGLYT